MRTIQDRLFEETSRRIAVEMNALLDRVQREIPSASRKGLLMALRTMIEADHPDLLPR